MVKPRTWLSGGMLVMLGCPIPRRSETVLPYSVRVSCRRIRGLGRHSRRQQHSEREYRRSNCKQSHENASGRAGDRGSGTQHVRDPGVRDVVSRRHETARAGDRASTLKLGCIVRELHHPLSRRQVRQQPAVLVLTPQQGPERNNHTAVQLTWAPVGDPCWIGRGARLFGKSKTQRVGYRAHPSQIRASIRIGTKKQELLEQESNRCELQRAKTLKSL